MRVRVFLCLAAVVVATACDQPSQPSGSKPSASARDERQTCLDKEQQLIAQAKALIAENKPEEASAVLAPCWKYSTLPEYRATDNQASAMIAKEELDKVPVTDTLARYGALSKWRAYVRELPAPYESEYRRLDAAEQALRKKRIAIQSQIAKMDHFWGVCVEAGATLRTPVAKRQQPRAELVIAAAGFAAADVPAIERREIRIGMDECALAATLGRPSDMNRTVGSYGRHDQWVYERGGYRYVYTKDGIVTSYQQ